MPKAADALDAEAQRVAAVNRAQAEIMKRWLDTSQSTRCLLKRAVLERLKHQLPMKA